MADIPVVGQPTVFQPNPSGGNPNFNAGWNPNSQMGSNNPTQSQYGQFSFPVDITSNPIAQIGLNQATNFINRINVPTVSSKWLNSLRYYFAVNNSYVLNKLKIIACPFLHKSWSRRISRQAEGVDTYEPPNQDINAPDLYIPSMAFITYVLLVGFLMGIINNNFTPEILGMTASTGLITMLVEVMIFKAGLYLLNFPSISLFEIIAYCGYKYVGITANMMSGMVLGRLAFHVTWFVNSLFMAVFMVKTLRLVIPKPVETRAVNTRNYFLFFLAIMQFAITYFMCFMDFQMQVKDTSSSALGGDAIGVNQR